jgi:hypothetical protein
MADSVPNNGIYDIFTYRTGYAHPFGERTYHSRVVLTALSAEDSVHMAEAVLSTESLPQDLNALVAAKAEGNLFFGEGEDRRAEGLARDRAGFDADAAGDDDQVGLPVEDMLVEDDGEELAREHRGTSAAHDDLHPPLPAVGTVHGRFRLHAITARCARAFAVPWRRG